MEYLGDTGVLVATWIAFTSIVCNVIYKEIDLGDGGAK